MPTPSAPPGSHRAPPGMRGLLDRARRRTLVVCPIGLGNFIMATPCLKALGRALGKENVDLLALRGGIKQMAQRTGYVGKVHLWDPDVEPLRVGLKRLWAIRREKYDFCINLFPSNNWRYCVYTSLLGARTTVGFSYPNTRLPGLLQQYSMPVDPDAHDTDQNCDLIETLLGNPATDRRKLEFPYAPEHPQAEQLKAARYYVVQPGSSVQRGMVEKRLPAQAYVELTRKIYREFGLKGLILGGPDQEALKREIIAQAPEAMLQFNSRDFHQLAALITHSRFYLGNDSGLMHIAAALGKSCITFFGPTDERRCGPYSDRLRFGHKGAHLLLRRDDLVCSPCWTARTVGANPPCVWGDYRCLTGFPIMKAWPQVREFIATLLGRP